jgi:hypothetical protein
MRQKVIMENITPVTETKVQQEPVSILEDAIDTSDYERTLRRGRNWLYAIAAIQFVIGIYEYGTSLEQTIGLIAFGIDAFIALVFLVFALWSRNKPVIAFTLALVFYIVFVLAFMILDPANILRGVLIKILVIIALVKANQDARQFEATKNF